MAQVARNGAGTVHSAPVFIVTAARSGSTLLRYLLRAHPSLVCPPETNLTTAWQAIFHTYAIAADDQAGTAWEGAAIRTCRTLAESAMGSAAKRRGATRWCDKSLSTAEHADLIAKVYPGAQCLLVYRRCADVVASALEASPWGLANYGFEPFVRDAPTNSVLAAVRYWLDRVQRQLVLEQRLDLRTLRVTYERLVTEPEPSLKAICAFLEVDYQPRYFANEQVFGGQPTFGPEDFKIGFTAGLTDDSVGRGEAIPLGRLVPHELLALVEATEREIGLDTVLDELEQKRKAPACKEPDASRHQSTRPRHEALAEAVRTRFAAYGAARARDLCGPRFACTAMFDVVDGASTSTVAIADGSVSNVEAGLFPRLTITCEVLDAVLAGVLPLSAVARRQLIGAEGPDGTEADWRHVYALTRAFLRVMTEAGDSDMPQRATTQSTSAQEPSPALAA